MQNSILSQYPNQLVQISMSNQKNQSYFFNLYQRIIPSTWRLTSETEFAVSWLFLTELLEEVSSRLPVPSSYWV